MITSLISAAIALILAVQQPNVPLELKTQALQVATLALNLAQQYSNTIEVVPESSPLPIPPSIPSPTPTPLPIQPLGNIIQPTIQSMETPTGIIFREGQETFIRPSDDLVRFNIIVKDSNGNIVKSPIKVTITKDGLPLTKSIDFTSNTLVDGMEYAAANMKEKGTYIFTFSVVGYPAGEPFVKTKTIVIP